MGFLDNLDLKELEYVKNEGLSYKYLYLKSLDKLNILGQFSIESSLVQTEDSLTEIYEKYIKKCYLGCELVSYLIVEGSQRLISISDLSLTDNLDLKGLVANAHITGSRLLNSLDLNKTKYSSGLLSYCSTENVAMITILVSNSDFILLFDDLNFVSILSFIYLANYLSLRKTKEIYTASITDKLTGAYNRHFLTELLSDFTDNNREYNIAILDIDFFKKFNDTYGHHAGDLVLKEVTRIFTSILPFDYYFIRYGGEEFIILGLDDYEDFIANVNNARKELIKKQWRLGKDTIKITVSIGVANSSEGSSPQEVIDIADKKLYWVKQNGRNNINTKYSI